MSSKLSPDDIDVVVGSLPHGFEFIWSCREARGKGSRPRTSAPPQGEKGEYVGQVELMRQILEERGLFIPAMTKDGGKDGNISMSTAYVLGEQPDFKVTEPSLRILVARLGGHCLVFPKCQDELNLIEMAWGRAKHYVRGHCDYTLPGMRANIPVILK